MKQRKILRIKTARSGLPALRLAADWRGLPAEPPARRKLCRILKGYIKKRRWFGGKARKIRTVEIEDSIAAGPGSRDAIFLVLKVRYAEGGPERYLLPVLLSTGRKALGLRRLQKDLAIAWLASSGRGPSGLVHEAIASRGFCRLLLQMICRGSTLEGLRGRVTASPTGILGKVLRADPGALAPSVGKAEQSNTAIIYGNRLVLKLFRRLERGENLDLEVGRFLTARGFRHSPPVAGFIEYEDSPPATSPKRLERGRGPASRDAGEVATLGILEGYVSGSRDAWAEALDGLGALCRTFQSVRPPLDRPPGAVERLLRSRRQPRARKALGPFVRWARLLGRRTAQLHLVLASEPERGGSRRERRRTAPDREGSAPARGSFAPEPLGIAYRRRLLRSCEEMSARNLDLLRASIPEVPRRLRPEALEVCGSRGELLRRFRSTLARGFKARRIRCHGDYHLGQVLSTGKDFFIIDFEGEPARELTERRMKHSPLRDVAGMLRSFHYASHAALRREIKERRIRPENKSNAEAWASYWRAQVSALFLKEYFKVARGASFLPERRGEASRLLGLHLLEKAVYELGYELNHRPAWVGIPLRGILQLLSPAGAAP